MKNYHDHENYKKSPPTEKQIEFVKLRLEGKKSGDIAKKLKVTLQTLHNWKQQDWFKELDARYRLDFYQECLAEVVISMRETLTVVKEILHDENSSNRDRLRAGEILLEVCDRWVNTQQIQRLEAVEKRQEEILSLGLNN